MTSFGLFAQTTDAWVYFKNKPNASQFISNPLSMLSQRALDRRERQQIALDEKDAPIEQAYMNFIFQQSNIIVLAKSKWLNALHVQGTYEDIQNLKDFNFVSAVEYADNSLNTMNKVTLKEKKSIYKNKFSLFSEFDYGQSSNQIEMIGTQALHEAGFTGGNMHIAVMDAGFPGVNTIAAFEGMRNNNRLLGGYNFVDRNDSFFTRSSHGTAVLSTMAAYSESEYIGSAPDASYYLFITEDWANEIPLEESLWVEAAEKADSLGVDIINTSLGYSVFFDDVAYNYTYEEMDGKTAFISRGAEVAVSRGMLVVNSAGNEGNDPWKYVNAPADVNNVLSVGAVDPSAQIIGFSSYGPTYDGRIKPDILAQGAFIPVVNSSGNIAITHGTSFSSPTMAGAVACLWQALSDRTNLEIIQLIRESGHLYASPTNQEGYGLPDLESVFNSYYEPAKPITEINAFPNPTSGEIRFEIPDEADNLQIALFNMLGKKVYDELVFKENATVNISHLSTGIYMLQMQYENVQKTIKLIKK